MSIIKQKIEDLINLDSSKEIKQDFGSQEFESLIREAFNNTTFNDYYPHSVTGNNPEEMIEEFEKIFNDEVSKFRKVREKIIKMRDLRILLKKYIEEHPEITI